MTGFRFTHRLHSSSFLGFVFRILQGNPKKELLWSLWVVCVPSGLKLRFLSFLWGVLYHEYGLTAFRGRGSGFDVLTQNFGFRGSDPS